MKETDWKALPFDASIHEVPDLAFRAFWKVHGQESSKYIISDFKAAWETGYRQAMVDMKDGKLVAFQTEDSSSQCSKN